jgi:hypothetical protein
MVANHSYICAGLTLICVILLSVAVFSPDIFSTSRAVPGIRDTLVTKDFKRAEQQRQEHQQREATVSSSIPSLRDILTTRYSKYAPELRELRVKAALFCSTPKPKGWPHTHKCLSSVTEMELLYMHIRETKPERVLEIASAIGFTSMWLLSALTANGKGVLYSFDVYQTPFPNVLDAAIESRHWKFTLGSVYNTYAKDFGGLAFETMLMDAEHTREFGAFYRDTVLAPQLAAAQIRADDSGQVQKVHITVHDVWEFENTFAVSSEGEVFLAWLGVLSPLVSSYCWTTNPKMAPRRHALITDIQEAAMGAEANAMRFGAFARGDLSVRCDFLFEPMPQARDCPLCLIT